MNAISWAAQQHLHDLVHKGDTEALTAHMKTLPPATQARPDLWGMGALEWCASQERGAWPARSLLRIVAALLRSGADPNYGVYNPPLLRAAEHGHLRICQHLVRAGAKVDIRNAAGLGILRFAAMSSSDATIAFIAKTLPDRAQAIIDLLDIAPGLIGRLLDRPGIAVGPGPGTALTRALLCNELNAAQLLIAYRFDQHPGADAAQARQALIDTAKAASNAAGAYALSWLARHALGQTTAPRAAAPTP